MCSVWGPQGGIRIEAFLLLPYERNALDLASRHGYVVCIERGVRHSQNDLDSCDDNAGARHSDRPSETGARVSLGSGASETRKDNAGARWLGGFLAEEAHDPGVFVPALATETATQ